MDTKNFEKDAVQNRFSAYLAIALKNNRVKYLHHKQQQTEKESLFDPLQEPVVLAVDDFTLGLSVIQQFENTQLVDLLISAPQQTRNILFLKVLYHLTFAQIANKLGLKDKNVSAIYYRFINKLKEKLEDTKQ